MGIFKMGDYYACSQSIENGPIESGKLIMGKRGDKGKSEIVEIRGGNPGTLEGLVLGRGDVLPFVTGERKAERG